MAVIGFLQEREYGVARPATYRHCKKELFSWLDRLAAAPVLNKPCQFSGEPRATFLVDFSPDGKCVASTHGDHTVRVCDAATGKVTHILKGHPRTPWCLAFHPTHSGILASGCLGGQVRIWDLRGGGSEMYFTDANSLIASLTFHPTEKLLVFSTRNKIFFWDWTLAAPLTVCSCQKEFETVRWVRFDIFGQYLFTGICNGTDMSRSYELHRLRQREQEASNDSAQDPMSQRRIMSQTRYLRLLGLEAYTPLYQDQERPTSPVHEDRLRHATDYARFVTSRSREAQGAHHPLHESPQNPPHGGVTASENWPIRRSVHELERMYGAMLWRRAGTNSPPPQPHVDTDSDSEEDPMFRIHRSHEEIQQGIDTVFRMMQELRQRYAREDYRQRYHRAVRSHNSRSVTQVQCALAQQRNSMMSGTPEAGGSSAASSEDDDTVALPCQPHVSVAAHSSSAASSGLSISGLSSGVLNSWSLTGSLRQPAPQPVPPPPSFPQSSAGGGDVVSVGISSLLMSEERMSQPVEPGACCPGAHDSSVPYSAPSVLTTSALSIVTPALCVAGSTTVLTAGRQGEEASTSSFGLTSVASVSSAGCGVPLFDHTPSTNHTPCSTDHAPSSTDLAPSSTDLTPSSDPVFSSTDYSCPRDNRSLQGDPGRQLNKRTYSTAFACIPEREASASKVIIGSASAPVMENSMTTETEHSMTTITESMTTVTDNRMTNVTENSTEFATENSMTTVAESSTETAPENSMAIVTESSMEAATENNMEVATENSMDTVAENMDVVTQNPNTSSSSTYSSASSTSTSSAFSSSTSSSSLSGLTGEGSRYRPGSRSCIGLHRWHRVSRLLSAQDQVSLVADVGQVRRLARRGQHVCDFPFSSRTTHTHRGYSTCPVCFSIVDSMSEGQRFRFAHVPENERERQLDLVLFPFLRPERTAESTSQTTGDLTEPQRADCSTDVIDLPDESGTSALWISGEGNRSTTNQSSHQQQGELAWQLSETDERDLIDLRKLTEQHERCIEALRNQGPPLSKTSGGRLVLRSQNTKSASSETKESSSSSSTSQNSGPSSSVDNSETTGSCSFGATSSSVGPSGFLADAGNSSCAATSRTARSPDSSQSTGSYSSSAATSQNSGYSSSVAGPVLRDNESVTSAASSSTVDMGQQLPSGSATTLSSSHQGENTAGSQSCEGGPFHTLPGVAGDGGEGIEVMTGDGASETISFTELAHRLANRDDVLVVGNHRRLAAASASSPSSSSSSSVAGCSQRSDILRSSLDRPVSTARFLSSSSSASSSSAANNLNRWPQFPRLPRILVQRPSSDDQPGSSSGQEHSGLSSQMLGGGAMPSQDTLHPHYARSVMDAPVFSRYFPAFQSSFNSAIAGVFMSSGEQAVASNIVSSTFRIQRWDMRHGQLPDLTQREANVVVHNSKIHNDASIDLSKDSSLLATFVHIHGGFPDENVLAVFSLQQDTLGQCLFTKSFGPNAISVSISPSNQYLIVGLASKRMLFFQVTEQQLVGQVYRMVKQGAGEDSMKHITDVYHPIQRPGPLPRGVAPVSVNCARWLPYIGEGMLYGTNHGDLNFFRSGRRKEEVEEEESRPRKLTVSTQTGTGVIHRSAFTQTAQDQQ